MRSGGSGREGPHTARFLFEKLVINFLESNPRAAHPSPSVHTEAKSEQSRQRPGLSLRTKGALPPFSLPSRASRLSAHGLPAAAPRCDAAPLRVRHAAPRRPAAPSPAGRPGRTHPAPPGRLSAAARAGAASPPSRPRSSPGPATRTCSWCERPARGPGAAWRGRERSKPITRKNRASFSGHHSAAATAPPCWHRHVIRVGSPPSRRGLRPLRGAGGSGRGGSWWRCGHRWFEESLEIKFQVLEIQSSWPIVYSYVQLSLALAHWPVVRCSTPKKLSVTMEIIRKFSHSMPSFRNLQPSQADTSFLKGLNKLRQQYLRKRTY